MWIMYQIITFCIYLRIYINFVISKVNGNLVDWKDSPQEIFDDHAVCASFEPIKVDIQIISKASADLSAPNALTELPR